MRLNPKILFFSIVVLAMAAVIYGVVVLRLPSHQINEEVVVEQSEKIESVRNQIRFASRVPGQVRADGAVEITTFPGATEIVASLNSSETEPLEDIQTIQEVLTVFRKANGKNPFGSENFEIVAGLIGNNEKKLAVLASNHPAINDNGELIDRWGTPYFFHAETSKDMQVVSAGPDKQLFTQDDIQLPEAVSAAQENHELTEDEIVFSTE